MQINTERSAKNGQKSGNGRKKSKESVCRVQTIKNDDQPTKYSFGFGISVNYLRCQISKMIVQSTYFG